jgi:DNA-binding MarR family transcriptional regulator
MEAKLESGREMRLLEQIEIDPDINQATLADRLGVAVGTVNWHLKRLVAKGYVKVKRAERKKLRYIITAEGIAFRARLTVDYIDQSFRLYRRIRSRAGEQIQQLREQGHQSVAIRGDGDIAEILYLSCLEQGISVVEMGDGVPVLEVEGVRVVMRE